MATIIPFKAIRPSADKVHLVASRSVDTYSIHELQEKLENNPFTFLHVVNPDFRDGNKTKPGSKERLQKIKSRYEEFVRDKIFVQDQEPCYYVYQQVKANNTYTGIIACSSIDDYFSGIIKIHEQTLTDREEKLKEYLEVCDFNAEPVLFSYPNNSLIDQLTLEAQQLTPAYNFSTTDKVKHTVWVIRDNESVKTIQKEFAKIPAVYIADGHHRSASSARLGKSKRDELPGWTGKESFNFYLGAFFPENQLRIFDFNRVVKDLNGLSVTEFLKKLSASFDIEEKRNEIYKPQHIHNFSMYLEGNWYSCSAKPEIINSNDPVGSLDASILTKSILSPILNIHDLKTDKRIGFVSGIKGMEELKKQVDSGKFALAFGLYPVSMTQLKHIADTNNIMPPKTTWVEPKLRSGLLVYSLEGNAI